MKIRSGHVSNSSSSSFIIHESFIDADVLKELIRRLDKEESENDYAVYDIDNGYLSIDDSWTGFYELLEELGIDRKKGMVFDY